MKNRCQVIVHVASGFLCSRNGHHVVSENRWADRQKTVTCNHLICLWLLHL